ncbi:MAG: hypothetical protein HYY02_13730 [Chloroflexi bacterium]|nr:hypothetical protein [Chloroflexota bacterium]
MFVLRSEQVLRPDRASEYEEYQEQAMGAIQPVPGFLWEVRLRYLGNYARRLIYQAWDKVESRLAYSRSSQWVRAPEGLLAAPAATDFCATVAQVEVLPFQVGISWVDRQFRLSNGHQEEFEAIETGLCDLALGQPGFVARFILKFFGNDTSYRRVSVWRSWEDLQAWATTPVYVGENDAILGSVVWTSADRYEVLATASSQR